MRNKVRSLQQFEVPILSPSYIGKSPFSSSNSDAGDFEDSDDDLPPPLVESNAPAPSSPERAPLCGETPPKLSLITSQNDLPADRKASSPFSTNRTHDVLGESGHSKAASAAAAVANSTVPTGGSETHGHSGLMIRTLLCYSMSGNPVPLLTITDFSAPQNEIAKRKYVVLSARVHPGESPASYMIDGVIDFLCGQTAAARTLRKLAVFKIVPMLNPDGVAAGNHRCNLAGHDLNRRWNAPSKELAPTIYHLKEMIRNLVEMRSAQQVDEESNRSRTSRENMDILHAPSPGGCSVKATLSKSSHIRKGQGVALFCDFHAHSGKKNIFIYGCENSKGAPERLFPLALSKMSETFSFQDCSFKVQKKKSNCGRIVVHKELGVVNSYTVSID
jgi:hypothetical protein